MKRIKKLFTLSAMLMLMGFNDCNQQSKEVIEQKLLGSWISNNDSKMEIQFNGNVRKDFYDGDLLFTYKYSISKTCDSETISGNQYFLKSIDDSDNSQSCLIIEAVDLNNSGILSFTSDRGQLLTFNKK